MLIPKQTHFTADLTLLVKFLTRLWLRMLSLKITNRSKICILTHKKSPINLPDLVFPVLYLTYNYFVPVAVFIFFKRTILVR